MKRLRAIRRAWVKKDIIIFIILAIPFPVIIFLMMGGKAYKEWDELDFESNLSYVYVTSMHADIEGPYYIYGSMEEENLQEYYYVMAKDEYIIPVCYYYEESLEDVHNYMKAKEDYRQGKISEEELIAKRVSSIGRIYKANKNDYIPDLEKYLKKNPPSTLNHYKIVPYILNAEPDDTWAFCLPIFLILEMIPVFGLLSCFVSASNVLGEKTIRQYIKETGDSRILRKKIDAFFTNYELFPGFWLSHEYIAGLYETNVIFGELRKVTGMYKMEQVSGGNVAGNIALNLTSFPGNIKIRFIDDREYIIQLLNEEDVDTILDKIQKRCSWIETEEKQD